MTHHPLPNHIHNRAVSMTTLHDFADADWTGDGMAPLLACIRKLTADQKQQLTEAATTVATAGAAAVSVAVIHKARQVLRLARWILSEWRDARQLGHRFHVFRAHRGVGTVSTTTTTLPNGCVTVDLHALKGWNLTQTEATRVTYSRPATTGVLSEAMRRLQAMLSKDHPHVTSFRLRYHHLSQPRLHRHFQRVYHPRPPEIIMDPLEGRTWWYAVDVPVKPPPCIAGIIGGGRVASLAMPSISVPIVDPRHGMSWTRPLVNRIWKTVRDLSHDLALMCNKKSIGTGCSASDDSRPGAVATVSCYLPSAWDTLVHYDACRRHVHVLPAPLLSASSHPTPTAFQSTLSQTPVLPGLPAPLASLTCVTWHLPMVDIVRATDRVVQAAGVRQERLNKAVQAQRIACAAEQQRIWVAGRLRREQQRSAEAAQSHRLARHEPPSHASVRGERALAARIYDAPVYDRGLHVTTTQAITGAWNISDHLANFSRDWRDGSFWFKAPDTGQLTPVRGALPPAVAAALPVPPPPPPPQARPGYRLEPCGPYFLEKRDYSMRCPRHGHWREDCYCPVS
jgi:hypothetical protein